MQLNIAKQCLVFKINAFELVTVKYYGKNTWHRLLMGLKTVLRLLMTLGGTFSG